MTQAYATHWVNDAQVSPEWRTCSVVHGATQSCRRRTLLSPADSLHFLLVETNMQNPKIETSAQTAETCVKVEEVTSPRAARSMKIKSNVKAGKRGTAMPD
jgi:hypothetical protein